MHTAALDTRSSERPRCDPCHSAWEPARKVLRTPARAIIHANTARSATTAKLAHASPGWQRLLAVLSDLVDESGPPCRQACIVIGQLPPV